MEHELKNTSEEKNQETKASKPHPYTPPHTQQASKTLIFTLFVIASFNFDAEAKTLHCLVLPGHHNLYY